MKIIDISQEVLSCEVYPGDSKPEGERIIRMDDGECCNVSCFSMCAHNGTHIDAPFHFINDGKTVDKIPCDIFAGYCYVCYHNGKITGDDAADILKKASCVGANERILVGGKATVTEEAAKVFAESHIKLFGNEGTSVGPVDAPMQVHLIMLGADIALLEGIVLENVKEGKYFLSAVPLNLAGFDGSPCRAYLIDINSIEN